MLGWYNFMLVGSVSISITNPWFSRFYNSAVKSCFRKKVGKTVLAREFIKLNKSLSSYLSVLCAKVYSQLDMPNFQWLQCQRKVFFSLEIHFTRASLILVSEAARTQLISCATQWERSHIICNPVGHVNEVLAKSLQHEMWQYYREACNFWMCA